MAIVVDQYQHYYTVKPGDRLSTIATRYGISVARLVKANRLKNPNALKSGLELAIPTHTTTLPAWNSHADLAPIAQLILNTALALELDARLAKAVAWIESSWQQDHISPTGAIGIMQIEPETGQWIELHLAERTLNLERLEDNILAGCLLLRYLLKVHQGDIDAAVAAYYQGDSSIARHELYSDTRRYQQAVRDLLNLEGI